MGELRVNKIVLADKNIQIISDKVQIDADLDVQGNIEQDNYQAGQVIGYAYVRTDVITTISCPANIDTIISQLQMSFTPKKANSLLHCEWMLSGEVNHDAVYRVAKNGIVPADGYNTVAGNINNSGLSVPAYDVDSNSTPSTNRLIYIFSPGSVSLLTIAPTYRSSGESALTYYLNRSVGGIQENGVSWGFIWEIAQ